MAKRNSDPPLRITRLALKNWRNFKSIDIPLQQRAVVVGPNAVGKSNLLDSIRFLGELAGSGGGLAAGVGRRGGLRRLRFLNMRSYNGGRAMLRITLGTTDDAERWTYELQFTGSKPDAAYPVVFSERVWDRSTLVLDRPDDDDRNDNARLTQTALEQVARNQQFRDIHDFLDGVRYLHLVPQLIRHPERFQAVISDPFGTDFLDQIASSSKRERQRRLGRIREALRMAVPQLDELKLDRDDTGRPHLAALFDHWRPNAALQDERDFSDGTLRLIGLLWALLDVGGRAGVILLEEPELSLHAEIVAQLPSMFASAQASGGAQVVMTSHSADLLSDPGLGLDEVVLLLPGNEGTSAKLLVDDKPLIALIEAEAMTVPEAVRARTAPEAANILTTVIR